MFSLKCSSLRSIHFPKKKMDAKLENYIEVFSYRERISTSIFWIDLDSVIWMGLRGPNCLFWIETSNGQIMERGQVTLKQEVEIVVPGEGVEWKKKVKDSGGLKLQRDIRNYRLLSLVHIG